MLVVLCAITLNSTAQNLSLKGYTVGEKYTGKKITYDVQVGGLTGAMLISTLNDGTIYGIGFIPTDGDDTARVYYSDFEVFKSGVEKNYGVKLKWQADSDYSDNGRWKTSKNNIVITYEENEYMDKPIKMMFLLRDPKLVEINAKEEAAKASQQFK